MRQVLRGLAIVFLAFPVPPAAAQQQGSIQVSAAAQGLTGDPSRIAGQNPFEPDAGISWLQPGSRFGMFQIEVRATRRGALPHLGRSSLAARDVKYRGATWTLEAGDTYFTPSVGDYRFSNLTTPAVTFSGAALSGRTARSSLSIVAGRTTALRNIFGTDPDTLGQTLVTARAAHRPTSRVEVTARAARIHTTNLREFGYSIAATEEAGGGVRITPTHGFEIVADATAVSFRRAGSPRRERDSSWLAGASWLLGRGWVQVNASRFSPGEFSVLNYPLQDREGLFAAGEYEVLTRLRVFAGAEALRTNLDPAASAASARPQPHSEGVREFGGARLQIGHRSALTLRREWGDRLVRPVLAGRQTESDTGSLAAEYQLVAGPVTSFTRYSRRENVDVTSRIGTYTQQDGTAQLFVNLSHAAQVFGMTTVMRTEGVSSGNTYWQAGGGAQVQIPRRSLWMRTEATVSRNVDLLTQSFVPRESLLAGISGQISSQFSIAFNLNVERAPMFLANANPWMTRSTIRVTQRIPTGSARMSTAPGALRARARGAGALVGMVFADWNANGIADPGEGPLPGIPVQVAGTSTVTTGRDGQFTFQNVPAGLQRVGLDMTALPVDFDPPEHAEVQVEVSRGDTRRLSFGLIPLGSVTGRVLRDANGNGAADPEDEPIGDAVLILDGGLRSEQARRGRFRFDAVRSGDHTVKLLVESMPEGAAITGAAEVPVSLGRDHLTADLVYLVTIEKRPEVRKVFPPKIGSVGTPDSAPGARSSEDPKLGSRPGRPTSVASAPSAALRTPSAAAPSPSAEARAPSFTVQIAALNDPLHARDLVRELRQAGFAAYLVEPSASDPDGQFKVRVGPYVSRAAAQKAVATLEAHRHEKFWVIKAR